MWCVCESGILSENSWKSGNLVASQKNGNLPLRGACHHARIHLNSGLGGQLIQQFTVSSVEDVVRCEKNKILLEIPLLQAPFFASLHVVTLEDLK